MRRALAMLCAGVVLAAWGSFATRALADGPDGLTGLVRGGAPLPQFRSNFPINLGDPGASAHDNLEISLTSSNHSVLHFLFSPRALAGTSYGFGPTITGSYAGLAWNVFDDDHLFGSIGFATAVDNLVDEDPTRQFYGPLLSLHSTFELGYQFSRWQSLSLALDHATPAPYLGDPNAIGDDLRIRYGLHF